MTISSIQTIEGVEVINQHPFGSDIAAFCMEDDNILVFPGHGFLDGGCYAFAIALKQYMQGIESKFYNVGRTDFIDHIVLQVVMDGVPLYLDGDGMGTAEDMINKTKAFDRFGIVELTEFIPELHDESETDVFSYNEAGIPWELTKKLRAALGDFQEDMLSLSYVDQFDELTSSQA